MAGGLLGYFVIAVFAGMLLPVQAGMNSELRRHLGQPVHAVLVNFTVGAIVMILATLVVAKPFVGMGKAMGTPWWAWMGGAIGAAFVLMATITAPKLGAVGLLIAAVAGQMLSSIVIDHIGGLNFPVHHITPGRICGLLLIVGGIVLVQRF